MKKEKKVASLFKTTDKPTLKKASAVFFVLFLVFAGFAVYANSLKGQFVWDDDMLIKDNAFIQHWSFLGKIFSQNILAGTGENSHFYRPLQIATYALDYSFWRFNVIGYHLTNILLHILVAWTLFRLIALLFSDELLGFLASALFIVHPFHVEAVSYISGRSDTLSALFLLMTSVFYIKQARSSGIKLPVLMLVSYAAALLSREQGLILPFLLLAYHRIFRKKIDFRNFFSLLGVALAYLLLRAVVLRGVAPDVVSTNAWERLPGFFVASTAYLKLFFVPFPLHMEYGQRLFSLTDPRALTGFVGLALVIVLVFRSRGRRQILLFSLTWFLLTLLPVSNIYPVGAFMAEHWMYLPSMGLFLLLAWWIRSLYNRKETRLVSLALAAGLFAFYSFLTIKQNDYWKDPSIFYERTLRFSPDSSRVLNNLGNLRQDSGHADEAIAFYEKALSLKPDYAQALNNLGIATASLKKYDQAVGYYQKALADKPQYADAYYNLANAYQNLGRSSEAISCYEKALALRPDNADYCYNLANAYRNSGRVQEAISSYRKVIELRPDLTDAANNLGLAYIAAGKKDEARAIFENLIDLHPDYAKAYTNLAILCYEDKQLAQARQYCDKALKLCDSVDPEFLKLIYE